MNELQALKAIDFDWTVHLKSVWSDSPYDVPTFQEELRQEFAGRLDDLNRSSSLSSPLGWPVVGSGGMGKTHLLSVLRRFAIDRQIAFVLVDMTDVHDFWETVLLGYLNSLQQECAEGRYQYQAILERFLETLSPQEPAADIIRKLQHAKTQRLAEVAKKVLGALSRKYREQTLRYQDVIRAVIALNSNDFEISSTGLTWLQGHEIEDQARSELGFATTKRLPREIVEALSWLMSLVGPVVLALDQLDPIVTHLSIASGGSDIDQSNEEIRVARSIIEKIASGFGALRDVTQRTLIVISCLETTWNRLAEQVSLKTNLDRYEPPRRLKAINCGELAEAVLLGRMVPAYRRVNYCPPYPTWPFTNKAFAGVQGLSPRQLLQFGYEHVRKCMDLGQAIEVNEIAGPSDGKPSPKPRPEKFGPFDARFEQYRQQAEPAWILDEQKDDERLAPLLQTACRCLLREAELPTDIEAVVDVDFHGGKTTRPLHARVRLIYHHEGEREEHFCLRALERANARAFQARLNAAMIQSGIDRHLGFRHLAVVRATALPGGQVTNQLIQRFNLAGGVFVIPTDEELRTLWALEKLNQENDDQFFDWLRLRRPASKLAMLNGAISGLCSRWEPADEAHPGPPVIPLVGQPAVAAKWPEEGNATTPGASVKIVPQVARPTQTLQPACAPTRPSMSEELTLGWQLIGERLVEPIRMSMAGLEKHTVVLAGAGSGKTVLIRRLVEEVALLGVPSIVVDCANDLATLGDQWPQPPEGWGNGDEEKAKAYFEQTSTVIWTPGREAGNPLCLEPLPDLAAVADDEDELTAAVEMVRESLQKIVAPGSSAATAMKMGILSSALRYFAKRGGGRLGAFVPFLRELPADAGLGVHGEAKLARDMGDRLKVEIETNVLLRDSGATLDPAVLLGDTPNNQRTRISVVSLVGLAGLEAQRHFLNQLAMTLFSWIKKNPSPGGRTLRGLLVIDEAKDFVPSQASTACKPSLMRLVAQARKYHLGIVFATQNPKEIENTIIGNCSTHYYGKAGSPETIKIVREQIHSRGGSGDDVPTLPKGTFYVYNADAKMAAPMKVRVPMCLSHHHPNPLDEQEIIHRAAISRRQTHVRR
jgi:hypothetical protein